MLQAIYTLTKRAGFSLVELSVVLAVIGVTLGGALSLATQKTEEEKIDDTDDMMEVIESALARYVAENGRLPCPALDQTAISASTFGKEAGTPTSASCPGLNSTEYIVGNVYKGIVPVKTLGLPDEFVLDGWERRIAYAVDYRLANNTTTNATCDGTTSTVCFKYTSAGSIQVNDSSGTARTTQAAYVLISYGKNGHGAFRWNSATSKSDRINAGSADTDENTNAHSDSSGGLVALTNAFVQKTTDTTFDDIVYYKEKSQIIDDANLSLDASICSVAEDASENPGANDTCGNATSVTNCESLGTQVFSWCLEQ